MVYYQNVNGLRTKLNDIKHSFASSVHDVVVLTETNLDPNITNNEIGAFNHQIFRKDRSGDTSRKISGGGVLVAVDKSLPCCEIKTSNTDVECLFIKISLKKRSNLYHLTPMWELCIFHLVSLQRIREL